MLDSIRAHIAFGEFVVKEDAEVMHEGQDASFMFVKDAGEVTRLNGIWVYNPHKKIRAVYACTYPDKNICYFWGYEGLTNTYACFLNPRVSACVSCAAI